MTNLRVACWAAFLAIAAAGCGASGGGGGSAVSSAAAASTAGPKGPIATDFDAPEVTITAPARATYLQGSPSVQVTGKTSDVGSGLRTLELNGRPIGFDQNGDFSTSLALEDGVNTIVVRGTDWAGNIGNAAISVMYALNYRLATDDIPGAAGSRLNEAALNAMAPVISNQIVGSGIVQSQLTRSPLFRGDVRDPFFNQCLASAEVQVLSITFGAPVITFDTIAGGLDAHVDVPSLAVTASSRSYCGIGYSVIGNITASNALVDFGLDVGLSSGRYVVTARQAAVDLRNFRWGINGIPSIITNLVYSMVKDEIEKRLAEALRQEVPKALQSQLQGLSQPIARTFNGQTVTFRLAPEQIQLDDAGLQVDFTGNVTAARNPLVPLVPGSFFIPPPAGRPPAYGATQGFYAGLNANMLNRALFTSWQAGFWNLTIDTAFLRQLGLALPFQLDGQLLAVFFPPLRAMITPGMQVPLGLQFEPQMQPVLRVTGAPDLFELDLGELKFTVLLDFGAGYQPLLTLALHVRAGTTLSFANGALSFSMSQNMRVEADQLSSAIPLNGMDVERFVTFLAPAALQVATQSIGPVPVPTVQGLSFANVSIYRDGLRGEFCTVSGDIR